MTSQNKTLLESTALEHAKRLTPILEEHLKNVEENRVQRKEEEKQQQAENRKNRAVEAAEHELKKSKKNYTFIMVAAAVALLAFLFWNFKSELIHLQQKYQQQQAQQKAL